MLCIKNDMEISGLVCSQITHLTAKKWPTPNIRHRSGTKKMRHRHSVFNEYSLYSVFRWTSSILAVYRGMRITSHALREDVRASGTGALYTTVRRALPGYIPLCWVSDPYRRTAMIRGRTGIYLQDPSWDRRLSIRQVLFCRALFSPHFLNIMQCSWDYYYQCGRIYPFKKMTISEYFYYWYFYIVFVQKAWQIPNNML